MVKRARSQPDIPPGIHKRPDPGTGIGPAFCFLAIFRRKLRPGRSHPFPIGIPGGRVDAPRKGSRSHSLLQDPQGLPDVRIPPGDSVEVLHPQEPVEGPGAHEGAQRNLLPVKDKLPARCEPQKIKGVADDVLKAGKRSGLPGRGHGNPRHGECRGGTCRGFLRQRIACKPVSCLLDAPGEGFHEAKGRLVIPVHDPQAVPEKPVSVGNEAGQKIPVPCPGHVAGAHSRKGLTQKAAETGLD